VADEGVNRQAAGIERVTRRRVAERLGISVTSVRRLEGTRLHPKRDTHGVWLFDAAEVEALASQPASIRRHQRHDDAGEVASQVFQMLEEGHELSAIVIALRQSPARIRELYDEWTVDLKSGRIQRQSDKDLVELQRSLNAFHGRAK